MATITIRVSEELKAQMDKLDLNWSDVLRDAIEDRLRQTRRQRAAERMDARAKDILQRTGRYSNMSEEILRWRKLH